MAMCILCFFKRYRKFAAWTGFLALALTIVALGIVGTELDAKAREAGYKNAEDHLNAQRAGILDPARWNKQRETFVKKWAAEEKQKEAAAEGKINQQQAQADASCRKDFNCWSNRFNRAATKVCAPQIEQAAKNNFEWTDSLAEPKFPRASIAENGATITYVGDAIKMQNGFGGWIIMTYECDFDTAAGKAVAVRVNPGQLSN
ncbi:hypothetical protein [Rhizobium laguerreae]|nr:hypothetical protein [Rhizobium laguerreae]